MAKPHRLAENFVHLGLGATAVPQPPFDGLAWYEAYEQRHGGDGREGRLVSQYCFTESWDSWEMHPGGDEMVICISGVMTLIQETPEGRIQKTVLAAGEYAINPPGVWHTADVDDGATAIFITAGEGTEHRPR